jgi:hypothetical protein
MNLVCTHLPLLITNRTDSTRSRSTCKSIAGASEGCIPYGHCEKIGMEVILGQFWPWSNSIACEHFDGVLCSIWCRTVSTALLGTCMHQAVWCHGSWDKKVTSSPFSRTPSYSSLRTLNITLNCNSIIYNSIICNSPDLVRRRGLKDFT